MDSLKSISLSKKSGNNKQNDEDLDKIEEDMFEEDDVVTPQSQKKTSLKAVVAQSSLGISVTMMQRLKNNVLASIDQLMEDIEAVPEMIAA